MMMLLAQGIGVFMLIEGKYIVHFWVERPY